MNIPVNGRAFSSTCFAFSAGAFSGPGCSLARITVAFSSASFSQVMLLLGALGFREIPSGTPYHKWTPPAQCYSTLHMCTCTLGLPETPWIHQGDSPILHRLIFENQRWRDDTAGHHHMGRMWCWKWTDILNGEGALTWVCVLYNVSVIALNFESDATRRQENWWWTS